MSMSPYEIRLRAAMSSAAHRGKSALQALVREHNWEIGRLEGAKMSAVYSMQAYDRASMIERMFEREKALRIRIYQRLREDLEKGADSYT